MTPLERVIVSVDGAVDGTASGFGKSTPGRGSVRGTLSLEDPPNSFESQPPAVLAPSEMAGSALACAAAAVVKQRLLLCKPRCAPAASMMSLEDARCFPAEGCMPAGKWETWILRSSTELEASGAHTLTAMMFGAGATNARVNIHEGSEIAV